MSHHACTQTVTVSTRICRLIPLILLASYPGGSMQAPLFRRFSRSGCRSRRRSDFALTAGRRGYIAHTARNGSSQSCRRHSAREVVDRASRRQSPWGCNATGILVLRTYITPFTTSRTTTSRSCGHDALLDQGLDHRRFVGQVTRVTQLVTVVAGAVFRRPHWHRLSGARDKSHVICKSSKPPV